MRKYPFRASGSKGKPSGPVRGREGKVIDCKLCGETHFLSECPYLDDARTTAHEKVGRKTKREQYNSNLSCGRGTPPPGKKQHSYNTYNFSDERSEHSESESTEKGMRRRSYNTDSDGYNSHNDRESARN